jgi:hypothetical protein
MTAKKSIEYWRRLDDKLATVMEVSHILGRNKKWYDVDQVLDRMLKSQDHRKLRYCEQILKLFIHEVMKQSPDLILAKLNVKSKPMQTLSKSESAGST